MLVSHSRYLEKTEKKRKEFAFLRQFNGKPSIILGCPDITVVFFAFFSQALLAYTLFPIEYCDQLL